MPINSIIQAYLAAQEQGRRAGQAILQKEQFAQQMEQRKKEEADNQKLSEQRIDLLKRGLDFGKLKAQVDFAEKALIGKEPTKVNEIPQDNPLLDPASRTTERVAVNPFGGPDVPANSQEDIQYKQFQSAIALEQMKQRLAAPVEERKFNREQKGKEKLANIRANATIKSSINSMNTRLETTRIKVRAIDAKNNFGSQTFQGFPISQLEANAHNLEFGVRLPSSSKFDASTQAYMQKVSHTRSFSPASMKAIISDVGSMTGALKLFRVMLTTYKGEFKSNSGLSASVSGLSSKVLGKLHLSEFGSKVNEMDSLISQVAKAVGGETSSKISNEDVVRARKILIDPQDSYSINIDRYNAMVDLVHDIANRHTVALPKEQRQQLYESLGFNTLFQKLPGGTQNKKAKGSKEPNGPKASTKSKKEIEYIDAITGIKHYTDGTTNK